MQSKHEARARVGQLGATVRNLLVVPLGYEVVLRKVKNEVEENDKRQVEKEIGGNGAEDGQAVEEREEIYGCKKCREG